MTSSAWLAVNLRVLIVDDHKLIAQGLAVSLEAEGMDVAIVVGPTLDDILAAARRFRPDVVLLDLQLEEAGNGLELVAPLRDLGAQVLVLTGVTDRVRLAQTVEAGATGLARKNEPFDQLIEKVMRAARGQPVQPEHERYALLDALHAHRADERARMEPFQRLTEREREVLAALMNGKSADTIANEAFVSIATVRTQIRAILQKLEVSSQIAAVATARKAGWAPGNGRAPATPRPDIRDKHSTRQPRLVNLDGAHPVTPAREGAMVTQADDGQRLERGASERGAVAIEWALIAVLVSVVIIAGTTAIGISLTDFFGRVAEAFPAG